MPSRQEGDGAGGDGNDHQAAQLMLPMIRSEAESSLSFRNGGYRPGFGADG